MKTYVLAFDQGTTSSRAIVFGDSFKVAAVALQGFVKQFLPCGWPQRCPSPF